jgi:hypothetical protein
MKLASIELHIEQLVLHGFAPGDRYTFSNALEDELARMFAQQGVPRSLFGPAELEQISGRDFRIARGATPRRIGTQAAQAVYRGFNR